VNDVQAIYTCVAQLFPIKDVAVKLNEINVINAPMNANISVECTASDNICACSMNHESAVTCDDSVQAAAVDEICHVRIASSKSCAVVSQIQVQSGPSTTNFGSVSAQCDVNSESICKCSINNNETICSGSANSLFGVCSLALEGKTCELQDAFNVVVKAKLSNISKKLGNDTFSWFGEYLYDFLRDGMNTTYGISCFGNSTVACVLRRNYVIVAECGGAQVSRDSTNSVHVRIISPYECQTLKSPGGSQVF
jgi:hypothetical protein